MTGEEIFIWEEERLTGGLGLKFSVGFSFFRRGQRRSGINRFRVVDRGKFGEKERSHLPLCDCE